MPRPPEASEGEVVIHTPWHVVWYILTCGRSVSKYTHSLFLVDKVSSVLTIQQRKSSKESPDNKELCVHKVQDKVTRQCYVEWPKFLPT